LYPELAGFYLIRELRFKDEIVSEEILKSFVFYITVTESRAESLSYDVNKRDPSPFLPSLSRGWVEQDFLQCGHLLKPLEPNAVISYN
jgi:hypothetical protein